MRTIKNVAKNFLFTGALAGLIAATGLPSGASVTTSEAVRLKSELTPLGGQRSGNSDGKIPPWQGGYTEVWPGYSSGQPRPDPFAAEQPVLRITSQNVAQHADKLSAGVKALLQRFPSMRLDVYPSHRTGAAPAFVYDNTLRNATRARTKHGGVSIEGAYGGIPFPIPQNGAEAIWNHLLAWKGEAVGYEFRSYVVASRDPVMTTGAELDVQFPYYDRKGDLDRFGGIFMLAKIRVTAPPFKVGENALVHDPVDQLNEGRKAWQYIVGQRRVRRAPTIAYDNPSSLTSGFSLFDESFLFNGAIDRYQWKLIGKQELVIPYNTHRFHSKKVSEVLGPDHLNPDHVRWELHRVWVVEATLAPGKRHVIPKRRFYLDEDTWLAVLSDGWDARGQLWHVGMALPFVAPELPAVITAPYVMFDLVKGGYVASSLFNERGRHYKVMKPRPEGFFSPGALAAEGVR